MELTTVSEYAQEMRRRIIKMLHLAGSGHPGGSLSCTDVLAYLYSTEMHIDSENPNDPDRDRFIMSKGHCAPALYAALSLRGYFPEEELKTLRKLDSRLQGHPDMRKLPGVEMSSGSLGQGLSVANGMALAGRLDGRDYYVYVMMGDGEIEEGQVWEASMYAAHYQLGHVIAFLDHNGIQLDGRTKDIMNSAPLKEKWESFNWHVQQINGHDYQAIAQAVANAKKETNRPSMIICDTIKGKGVSFMEDQVKWHGSAIKDEDERNALSELG